MKFSLQHHTLPTDLKSANSFNMSAPEETKPDPTTEDTTAPKAEESTSAAPAASYTDMASNAASSVAGTAGTTAQGVKDSVFSMFGGGAKKEKKEE